MKDMEKIVVGAVLIIVVIALAYIVVQNSPNVDITTTTLAVTQPTESTLPADVQRFREAMGGSDTSGCDKIADERLKQVCIRDISIKNNDVSICDKVTISTLADTCYFRIALNTQNKALCGKITAENIKTACNSRF